MGYGGSYGGLGGRNYEASGFGQPYGSAEQPIDFGSGGSNSSSDKGGGGGGKLRLIINNNLSLDGEISANGSNGKFTIPTTSGGSGGSVYITTNLLTGTGVIRANGGESRLGGAGGSGGRVAVYGERSSFSGQIEAKGGQNSDNLYYNGQDGTVYFPLL